ncbi:MAG TPA: ScpA family protein, partial [Methyloceanibacter sp.]|nr:ScpA family protein [Methyloceanibacter sp.]
MSAMETPVNEDTQERDALLEWEGGEAELEAGDRLVVDVEGFEGPLDLLLALARTQKVDLAKISVLALAQQYLDFIAEARRLRLEIAADYLVMAAWLAFLKSKLLLPAEPSEEGEPTGAELAALLAFRLKRLDAMREASAQLMTRKRLGRDVFARGLPEPMRVTRKSIYGANVYDLLKAYSQQRQRMAVRSLRMPPRAVWS